MNKKPKQEITDLQEQRLDELDADNFASALRNSSAQGPVATLLMPMERRGAETRKNHIVFKNLLRTARETVADGTHGSADLAVRLAALESFDAPTHDFWQNQEEGLALVVDAGGQVTAYKVPFTLTPYVSIDANPYLGPLLRLAGGTVYYFLVIDLNLLRLYRATAWQLKEMPLNGLPRSLAESISHEQAGDASYQPGGRREQEAGVSASNHGVTDHETRQLKIRQFLERVNKNLAGNFERREKPLVVLGPPSEAGYFRSICSYAHLVDEGIHINPSALTPDGLRECICGWVRERDLHDRQQALTVLADSVAAGKGSTDFASVVKAAADGRVSSLFAKAGERRYGVNDRNTDTVTVHESPQEGDVELVEAAVLAAAEGGAAIHYFEGDEKLPGDACLAASYRY